MTRFFMAAAVAFTAFSISTTSADDKEGKAPKADVVIGTKAKAGKAKDGQVVEVQVQYPVVPPFPDNFVVKVDGKMVDSKTYSGSVTKDGKPVVGVGLKLVQFKAAGEGKQHVVVEYKKGDAAEKREVELTVTK
jgi:hypothetical protein